MAQLYSCRIGALTYSLSCRWRSRPAARNLGTSIEHPFYRHLARPFSATSAIRIVLKRKSLRKRGRHKREWLSTRHEAVSLAAGRYTKVMNASANTRSSKSGSSISSDVRQARDADVKLVLFRLYKAEPMKR